MGKPGGELGWVGGGLERGGAPLSATAVAVVETEDSGLIKMCRCLKWSCLSLLAM